MPNTITQEADLLPKFPVFFITFQYSKVLKRLFHQGENINKFWQHQTRGIKFPSLILSQATVQRNTNCSNNGKEQQLGCSSTITCIPFEIHRRPVQTWEEPCSHQVALPIRKLPESPLASLYKCHMFSNNLMFKGTGLGCHCQCLYPQRRSQLLSQTPVIQGYLGFCCDIIVK